MWTTTAIDAFDADRLGALIEGRVPALRIADFANAPECAGLAGGLLARSVRTHSVPEVTRLGISQYEQGIRGSMDDYLDQAEALRPEFAEVFAASFDPVARFLAHLRAHGLDAEVMTETDGRRYWAGSGKLRNGATPIHVDFAPQDSPGWAVGDAAAQLAWILYLEIDDGGDLQVWDRRWEPSCDEHQRDHTYAYDPAVIAGAREHRVRPVVGDVVLINSRWFHSVTPTDHRLAFGSFVSVFADRRLRVWA